MPINLIISTKYLCTRSLNGINYYNFLFNIINLISLLPLLLGNEFWPLKHVLNIAMSRIINNILTIKLALVLVILIIYGIGFCLTLRTLTAILILKLIKIIVFVLSIIYFSLFLFPIAVLYIITLEAKYLSFIKNIKGSACRILATLLSSTTAIVLCVFIMLII
jgi:hypothetical protein